MGILRADRVKNGTKRYQHPSVELESGAEPRHVTLSLFRRLREALKRASCLHTLAFESKLLAMHCKCGK
jgi:hypothetical protein